MRLIDADAIPYTMLYKENWMKGTGEEAQGAWKSDIDKMPTIDAVPVVRCKDCVYYYNGWGEELCHRGWTPKDVSGEWFCPKGERRDDEADNL